MAKDMPFLFLSLPFAVITARSVCERRSPRTSTAGGLGRDEGTATIPESLPYSLSGRVSKRRRASTKQARFAYFHLPAQTASWESWMSAESTLPSMLGQRGEAVPATATLPNLGAPRT